MAVSRRAKPGLTGFVAFMKRDDAEKAVRDLDGYDWAGCALRVGWGKPTPIPPRPLYGMCHPHALVVLTLVFRDPYRPR
jgi:U2-associated protein SR140